MKGKWQKLGKDKMLRWLDDDCKSWEIKDLDESLV